MTRICGVIAMVVVAIMEMVPAHADEPPPVVALRATAERARAAERLASIGTLVAGLAHEIGTPMGVIQGRLSHAGPAWGKSPQERTGNSSRNSVPEASLCSTAIVPWCSATMPWATR